MLELGSKKLLKNELLYFLAAFEQFDIYLNRPDIVVQRIGKAPEKIIRAYNYLYKKRLKRSGLEEGSLQLNFKLPKILIETQPELVTNNTVQKFWVKAWDDELNLKQINVYVNDVPVFGESGFEIIESVKSYRKQFEITLVDGLNKIQFSSVNSAGTESFYETVEIFAKMMDRKTTFTLQQSVLVNMKTRTLI